MRTHAPFRPDDLVALDSLLSRANAVVPMRDIADGLTDNNTIGLRHDCDNVIEPAVKFAEWEAERGYRSSFYVLHTDPYWDDETLLRSSLERFADLGHEIGIHNNALAAAYAHGGSSWVILGAAVERLRDWGFDVVGTVAHGDPLCRNADNSVRFVNDEMFLECERGAYGPADRWVDHLHIDPVSLKSFSLEYDANQLSRAVYISESGGGWSVPFDDVANGFPYSNGQLHILTHPCHWAQAFTRERAAV